MELERDICPLLTIAKAISSNHTWCFCQQDHCAWWDHEDQTCALKSISYELSRME